MALTDRAAAWRELGERIEFRGHGLHVHHAPAEGPLMVLLHGYPSSSFDFRGLIGMLPDLNLLAFDFLGFGLSDKPSDHHYTLAWQADLCEELVSRCGDGGRVGVVAHDMGDSVATELMARDVDGELSFDLGSVLMLNGSVVIERASLTWVHRVFRSPLGPLAAKLTTEFVFRRQFGELFSDGHPLTDREAADQWSLICEQGGQRLGDKLMAYVDERTEYAERWHGAVRDWEGELALAWGLEDPVATTEVLAALRELRPAAAVTELAGLGHYPQIEAPQRLLDDLRSAQRALL